MTAPAGGAPRISDADISQVLALLKGVDSVELKATIPADWHQASLARLPLDPVEAQPRQVYFFDTRDLALDAAGLIVRGRRFQGGRGDTVVKLRPVMPDQLPPAERRSAAFNVELDVMPGGFVCSAACKGRASGKEIHDVAAGALPLRKVLSKEQRAFYAAHAPGGVELDTLVPLGPIFVLKARFGVPIGDPDSDARSLVAELWFLPEGSRILELSTRCLPEEAFHAAAETRGYLASIGIELGSIQEAKTRAALAYFSDALRDEGEAAST